MSSGEHADGRRARRERSRAAVIDALFALIDDGKVPPSAEDIAERSGVSVSSIFRMFDGLDDMRRHAFERFEERYSGMILAEFDDDERRDDRIATLIRSRVALYAAAGPLMKMARQRALDYEPIAVGVARLQMQLADQTQRCLAPECNEMTPSRAGELSSLVDTCTSPEAFELLSAGYARTERQIASTWRRAVAALVAEFARDTPQIGTRT